MISFIIPIYKVERYLPACVDSILNQTYKDIEVILVDDGSPDNCPSICDDYSLADSRVKVIHKENGGLSDARNTGLLVAKGEYVIFLDGDDFWADKECLKQLKFEMDNTPDCDFIGFNCSYYYPSNGTIVKWVPYKKELDQVAPAENYIPLLVESGTFPMSACLKIIKRNFLMDNHLFFIKNKAHEDIPWFIDLISMAKSCRFLNYYIYNYRKEVEGSISSSFSIKKWSDLLGHLVNGIKQIKEEDGISSSKRTALLSFWAYEYYILTGMLYFMSPVERNKYQQQLFKYDWITSYSLNPKVNKVNIVRKILGYRLTSLLLYLYQCRSISK